MATTHITVRAAVSDVPSTAAAAGLSETETTMNMAIEMQPAPTIERPNQRVLYRSQAMRSVSRRSRVVK